MDEPIQLREQDVRAVVRLLGTVAGTQEPQAARKRRLVQGLAELVHADRWLWVVSQLDDNGLPVAIEVLHDGFSEQQMAVYFEASYQDPPREQQALTELVGNRHVTRRRQQLINDKKWRADPAVERVNRRLDIGQSLYSLYPIDDVSVSGVGLHRSWGAQPFTPYQARLVHIVLSEIPWLHQVDTSDFEHTPLPDLPPRLRTVLGLLLDGQHRQQIADHLNLSPYTVRDYMSEIYRFFGVSSQVELIKRLTLGDGGDGLDA